MPLRPLPSTNFDSRELRAMDHFRHRSVQDAFCILDGDFWGTYLLQMSHSVPAVQHAVIAFSDLHERYLADDIGIPSTKVYCLQQYGRALKSLRDHLNSVSSRGCMTEEALLACLLFVCFEVLQGNDLAALTHLEAGLSIFANLPHSAEAMTNISKQESLTVLAKIFIRLDNQATSLIGPRPPTQVDPSQLHNLAMPYVPFHPSQFTISQARDALHVCLSRAHDFLRAETITPEKEKNSLDLATHERDRHLSSLSDWLHTHQGLLNLASCSSSPSDNIAILTSLKEEAKECAILWLIYLVSYIILSTTLDSDEITYDAYLPQFTAIIENAEAVLRSRVPQSDLALTTTIFSRRKRFFTIEMKVIHPLYFTAFKCRNHAIRQRAIELMRVAGKEGAWDGNIFARIGEHVMALEEGNGSLTHGACAEEIAVEERKRVHSVGFRVDREKGRVWVQCRRRRDPNGMEDREDNVWDKMEAVLEY